VDPKSVLEAAFSQPQKCAGHCDQQATLRFLRSDEPLIACYSCPAGYVSKVMAYGPEASEEVLRRFLTEAMGSRLLREDEIRTATRHPWDSGVAGFEIKAAYWNQNYRSSKSSDPDRQALFVCANCGSTYVKPLSEPGTTCANCGP